VGLISRSEQRALTGSFFPLVPQPAYYALADGPPDCFRYGSSRIGVLARARRIRQRRSLPGGLTPRRAVGRPRDDAVSTYFIRHRHIDPFVHLAMAVLCVATRGARRSNATEFIRPRLRHLAIGVLSIVFAYAPSTSNGSYPGGARASFVEVLSGGEHDAPSPSTVPLHSIPYARVTRFDSHARPLGRAPRRSSGSAPRGYEQFVSGIAEGGTARFSNRTKLARATDRCGLLFAAPITVQPRSTTRTRGDASRELVVAREYGDDRDQAPHGSGSGARPHIATCSDGRNESKPAVVPWAPGQIPHPYPIRSRGRMAADLAVGGTFDPVFAQADVRVGGRLLPPSRTRPDRPSTARVRFPFPFHGRFRAGGSTWRPAARS